MADFGRALSFVLDREGGYVDHPDDRGGATNQGITQSTYDRYREHKGIPPRPVRDMEDHERDEAYRLFFWEEADCDMWRWPVNLVVFDAAVNHGPGRAIRLLQRAAGAKTDGIVGPNTRAKVQQALLDDLLVAMRWERLEYYARIVKNDRSQATFLLGWVRRVRHLEDVWV